MNSPSTKRISIANIKSTSKSKDLNSASKIARTQLLLPITSPSKNIVRQPSTDSMLRSQQLENHSSDKQIQARQLLLEYLNDLLHGLHQTLSEQEGAKLASSLKRLSSIQDFSPFASEYFSIYNYYHSISLHQCNQQQVTLPLRYKQAKKILFVQENQQAQARSTRNKKIIDLSKQNQDLKKEVFKCRESIKDLQKRIIFLIEQFKHRKSIYLKQIEKLISIIQTSIKQIPDLITQKKQLFEKMRQENEGLLPNTSPKLIKKETEYNTLFYNYENSSEPKIEVSSIQRYKSQGKVRIKQ